MFSQEGTKTNDNDPPPKQFSVLRVIFPLILLRFVICVLYNTLSSPNLSLLFFRYPSVDWMICFPLSSAFKWAAPDTKEALNLDALAIIPPIKGAEGVCIFTRKDNNSLSLALQRYGPIR